MKAPAAPVSGPESQENPYRMSVDKKMSKSMIITAAPNGAWTIDLSAYNVTVTVTTTTDENIIRAITQMLSVIRPNEPKPEPVYHSGECCNCERNAEDLEAAYGSHSMCGKCRDVIECTTCDEQLNENGPPCCNTEHKRTRKILNEWDE